MVVEEDEAARDAVVVSTTLNFLIVFDEVHTVVLGYVRPASVPPPSGKRSARLHARRSGTPRTRAQPSNDLAKPRSTYMCLLISLVICAVIWLSSRPLSVSHGEFCTGKESGAKRDGVVKRRRSERTDEGEPCHEVRDDRDAELRPDDNDTDTPQLGGADDTTDSGYEECSEVKNFDTTSVTDLVDGIGKDGNQTVECDLLLQCVRQTSNYKKSLCNDAPNTSLSVAELPEETISEGIGSSLAFKTFSSFDLYDVPGVSWRQRPDAMDTTEREPDTVVFKQYTQEDLGAASSGAAQVDGTYNMYHDVRGLWTPAPFVLDLRADHELTPCKTRPLDATELPQFSSLSIQEKVDNFEKLDAFPWISYYAACATHIEVVVSRDKDVCEARRDLLRAGVPGEYFQVDRLLD